MADQSWETCKYKWDGLCQPKLYGCIHPKIIKMEGYRKIHNSDNSDLPEGVYAEFYPDYRFYSFPHSLEKILLITLQGLGIRHEEKFDIPRIEEEKIIKRAIAGCEHCKFYRPET